jgi:parallel beta-helix repeat protein
MLSAALSVLAALAGPAAATTYTVREDWSGDPGCETIQYAVWLASPGDTVLVMPGTYDEANGNLNKRDQYGQDWVVVSLVPGIVLRSDQGPELTIMDAHSVPERSTRGIYAESFAQETVIEGFTITGGHEGFGAGGLQVSGAFVRVRNCIFREAYGQTGGTINVSDGGHLVLEDCVFDSSYACCGVAGAVKVDGAGSSIEMRRNTFLNSGCGAPGGALAFVNGASAVVEGNEFVSCNGTSGGAIYVDGSSPEIRGNIFRGNRATGGAWSHGGAIAYKNGSGGVCENNVIVDNVAGGNGGGIYVEDSSPEITQTTLHSNSAASGGGLYLTGASTAPVLSNLLIAYSGGGGGVSVDASCSGITLSCSDVYANAGGNYVGMAEPTGQDGDISVNPLLCESGLTLQDCSTLRADSGSSCGQIGALGVSCVCAPRPSDTWSAVKWLYR